MLKAFIRNFLSLSILLLSVYSNLYAHTFKECICHSSKRTLIKSEHVRFGDAKSTQTKIIRATLSGTENEKCKLVAAEIEEEKQEWLSFKKFLANSNYFSSLFSALVFGFCCLILQKRLPSCKHSLYFSSYKWYILFRVIRIWLQTPGWQISIAKLSTLLFFTIQRLLALS